MANVIHHYISHFHNAISWIFFIFFFVEVRVECLCVVICVFWWRECNPKIGSRNSRKKNWKFFGCHSTSGRAKTINSLFVRFNISLKNLYLSCVCILSSDRAPVGFGPRLAQFSSVAPPPSTSFAPHKIILLWSSATEKVTSFVWQN